MTSQEVLDLAHSAGIFFGKGLDVNIGGSGHVDDGGSFTAWTQADIQNILHNATAVYHLTTDQQIAAERAWGWAVADWWEIRGTLPGIGDVGLYVQLRDTDKSLLVQSIFTVRPG